MLPTGMRSRALISVYGTGGHVLRQGAQRRAVIGGIGRHVDQPGGESEGELADQRGSGLHLAGPGALAGKMQPGQHRQARLAGTERQADQDGRSATMCSSAPTPYFA